MLRVAQLIRGEEVTVLFPTVSYDEHMEESASWSPKRVSNVVVAPGSTADVEDSARPYGTRAAYTLGFPRSFSDPLRGCRVEVRGKQYSVIGDPRPNDPRNCPTEWWYTAEVEAVDG